MKSSLVLLLICLFFIGCSETSKPVSEEEPLLKVPVGFPEPIFPTGNEITPSRVALGKRLFFDSILSVDRTLSCASCHRQELAFADDKPTSFGVRNQAGTRNAPSLANVAYHPYYLREGGVPTLEMQVEVPISEHNEFDFNPLEVVARMNKDSSYIIQSMAAYNRQPDYYVVARAIACFERTLLSGNSRYDQYAYQGNQTALTSQELAGKNLFFSERAGCVHCHSGFNFTNYAFENNGLYQYYKDPGRYRLTNKPEDSALFKVPSLRNAGVTSPYMHDGSLSSLEDVVEHYSSGGKQHSHRSPFVKPLNLSASEKQELVAFLKSLTDESFIHNKKFKP